jgi:hypothetical protein
MRKWFRWWAPVIVACVAWPASQASAQNLLDNPGFELPITRQGAPFDDNWEGFDGDGDGATADSANSSAMPRTGAMHLALSIINTNNSFAGAFQDVPGLSPGQAVTFSGWHKTISSPLDLGSEVRIEWRNPAGTAEVSRTPNSTPIATSDYVQFSLTANVPAGAGIARVVYAIQTFGPEPTNNGTVFLDDTSVTVIPEPGSIALLGAGALGLLSAARRRRLA